MENKPGETKMNIVMDNWEEILQTLKKEYQISEVPFNTWLKPLKVYTAENNVVTIIVPSELAGDRKSVV